MSELARTPRRSNPAQRKAATVAVLKRTVKDFLIENDLMGDTSFYSTPEWKARGEEYGQGAALVITTEGTLYGLVNGHYQTPGAYRLLEQFIEVLRKLGYWYELGTGWMILIYKL